MSNKYVYVNDAASVKNEMPSQYSSGAMAIAKAFRNNIKAAYGNNPSRENILDEETFRDGAHAACEVGNDDLMIEDEEVPPPPRGGDILSGEPGFFNKTPPCGKLLSRNQPSMGDTLSPIPALPEDLALLKGEVVFERVNEKIYVSLIAIDKNSANNKSESIKANGDPLGGYAYAPDTDRFLVSCCDSFSLGIIPMAFRISIPGYAGKQLIPLTDSLIYKHASPQQRKMIKLFREKNSGCDIQFVQSLSRS